MKCQLPQAGATRRPRVIRHAITKSISIDVSAMRLLLFMSDPTKWPRWSVFKVQELTHVTNEYWTIATPIGPTNLRIKCNAAAGLIEYVFTFGNTQWSVPGRVLKNGAGSELVLTLFCPEAIPKERFERLASVLDQELAWLKRVVELH